MDNSITACIQSALDEINETEVQLITLNKLNTERTHNYMVMLENIMDEHFNLCHMMFADNKQQTP